MAKAAYEGLKQADGRRPFVITRACYAGTQKYSTGWTGDNHSIWAHLQMAVPQLCNLGLSGMPFVGTDLGGFGSDTTPELLTRWVQLACFSPLFRNHAALGTRPQEPWQFGPKVLDIYRKYVKLRYQWLPYFYDLFWEEERTGAPILRPLVFHYPEEATASAPGIPTWSTARARWSSRGRGSGWSTFPEGNGTTIGPGRRSPGRCPLCGTPRWSCAPST